MNWRCPTTSPFGDQRIWPFRIKYIASQPSMFSAPARPTVTRCDALFNEAVILLDNVVQIR
jgi:hypothetical protein